MFLDPAFSASGEATRIDAFGGIDLRIPASETGGIISVWESIAAPGEGPPLHVHTREDEMFYILEGTFQIRCGEETFIGGPGMSCVLPRHVPHTYRNIGTAPGRLLGSAMPGGFENFFIEVARAGLVTMPGIAVVAARYGLSFVPDAIAPALERPLRSVASAEGLSRDEVYAGIVSG